MAGRRFSTFVAFKPAIRRTYEANWGSNREMRSSRSRVLTTIAVFATLGLTSAAQTTAIDPLRLTLECEQASRLTFRLTLQNVSTEPTAAVIGTVLANDKKYLPRSLAFTLKRTGVADTTFDYVDPSVSVVGGRVDPWLVPLPAGASYSVVVSIPSGLRESFASPAEVHVRLTTHEIGNPNLDVQGLRFIQVLVGTLTSDRIHFPESCRR